MTISMMVSNGAAVLRNESFAIREAAQTISLAFSDDPLIAWLRPQGRPWGELDSISLKWQRRRVQQAIHDDMVLRSIPARKLTSETKIGMNERLSEADNTAAEYGTIAIVQPPQPKSRWRWSQLISWVQLKFQGIFDPVQDPGADADRVDVMMASHGNNLAELRKTLSPRQLWYIEVIAVRPCLHGRGLGGDMLRSIIDLAQGEPIALECTNRKTIGFYQKFGFEMVKENVLDTKDSNTSAALFLMLRQ